MSTEALESDDPAMLARGAEHPAPLGSIFKLYVLLAISEAIEAGELTWNTQLTVAEENRSLPSGELQEAPAGTQVTVQEAATKMIEVSDNTATDMLIQAVGRANVEAAVAQAGHHDPELMTPFPSTRELFQIGWGDPAYLETWRTGDHDEQRALLDQLSRQHFQPHDVVVGGDPLWPQGVEWFASAYDVAAVHAALQAQDDPTIRDIMHQNMGVTDGPWDYIGYKGGSSLGVLTGSWYLEDTDGQGYIVVLQAATDDAAGLSTEAHTLFSQLASSAVHLTFDEVTQTH